MTYLQLVRRLARMCGFTASSTWPSTTVSQTGQALDAVTWLNDAWVEMQRDKDWRWMRSRFTVNTVDGDDTYAYGDCTDVLTSVPITRFAKWLITDPENPPTAYLTSAGLTGNYYLTFVSWERFRAIYRIGVVQEGPPLHITIDPQDNIVVGPEPNDIYTILGEYQRSAQNLTADADVPELPADFHLLLAYEALLIYGTDQAATEQIAQAENRGGTLKRNLMTYQLPPWKRGRPMV